MEHHIAPVWEILYKWIYFVHKWYIALLLGDIKQYCFAVRARLDVIVIELSY